MRPGVYKIENNVNGKIYVGSSVDVNQRFSQHKGELRKRKHHNQHLQHAWNKYGEVSFSFSVIEEVVDSSSLLKREQYHIDDNDFDNLYNMLQIAGSCLGVKRSAESCRRMSEAQSGENHRLFGKLPQQNRIPPGKY